MSTLYIEKYVYTLCNILSTIVDQFFININDVHYLYDYYPNNNIKTVPRKNIAIKSLNDKS